MAASLLMHAVLKGAIAGTIATLFHTAVMYTLRPRFKTERNRDLPPTQVTRSAARRTGKQPSNIGTPVSGWTALAHFGFGATAGALYAPFAARIPHPPMSLGVAYGIGVWAASYLGWIPAMRLRRSATREPAQRNIMMILAHAAWGAALAVVFNRLRSEKSV